MKEKLRELEKTARLLEPTADERKDAREHVVAYSELFLDQIDSIPAYVANKGTGEGILEMPISESGIGISSAIGLLRNNVDTPGLNPASGGHLGYIPGGGIYYSALGDYMADVFNRYAGVFYASPGAVRIENMLVRWMNGLIGFPETASGNLTTGGSLANLIAIVTARDVHKVSAAAISRSVIYLSPQAHHSVDKAIRIAGLAECVIRHVPMDNRFRMSAADLERQIRVDAGDGLMPFLVIASAGTTDVGAIDPLAEIGSICTVNNVWFHVDAAYGGFFVLTEEGKRKLEGIGSADSVVIDPHKGLFLPYGLGVVLVKNTEALGTSHRYSANYMQDAASLTAEMSPADLSPELTKHFRGLRLWLPLMLHGVAPFRACLEEKLLLARYFYEAVQAIGFVCTIEPELSVVTYRWIPQNGNADDFNRRLLQAVVADGGVFISSTTLDGEYTLRFACLAFRTHLETVDLLLSILKEKAAELEAS